MALKYKDNTGTIHFAGAISDSSSLCGQPISKSNLTSERVTCKFCIEVVRHCKTIIRNEYKA